MRALAALVATLAIGLSGWPAAEAEALNRPTGISDSARAGAEPAAPLDPSERLRVQEALASAWFDAEAVTAGADPNARDDDGRTPMHLATKAGSAEAVAALADAGADPNARDNYGWTPMHYAARHGSAAVAALAAAGADPNARDDGGWTPMHYAARHGSAAVAALAAAGADPNARDDGGWTPMHYAAIANAEAMAALAAAGADPNARDDGGWTPMHVAAETGSAEAVAALAAAGADPNARDSHGRTPMDYAARHGSAAVAALAAAGADVGADPNACDVDGRTPMHFAAEMGSAEAVAALAAAGADPNARNDTGSTPMHFAANAEAVAALAALGADPNARDDGGQTPMHVAAETGSAEAVAALAALGADPNARNDTGSTPMHYAAETGSAEAVAALAALAALGADPNARDVDGQTPMHYAAAGYGSAEAVAALAALGADPNARTDDGWTPMHYAAETGPAEAVAALAALGADPNARDVDGWTPMHYAAETGSAEAVAALADAGADPNARTDGGSTPMHYAARYGSAEAVAALATLGADPNARTDDGWTPMHSAAEAGPAEAVAALAALGVDPNARNGEGWSALALSSLNKNTEVAGELLRTHLPEGAIDKNRSLLRRGLLKAKCWFDDDLAWPRKECFLMVVNEVPGRDAGALIGFPVVKFSAHREATGNPVLHLGGGGPGFPMGIGGDLASVWQEYKRLAVGAGRDLYVMDPRGVGMAYPRLHCMEAVERGRAVLGENVSVALENKAWLAGYDACRERLAAEGRNLSHYNSRTVAQDVEALRQALGVEQWVLYGYSYGARYALTISRDFPDSVEAMVLTNATFPNDRSVEQWAKGTLRAFKRAFDWCGREDWCEAETLAERFWALVRRLDEEPLIVALPPYVTDSYQVQILVLTGRRLIDMAFSALYDADFFDEFPVLVENLERGRTGVRVFEEAVMTWFAWAIDEEYSDPVWYGHYCSEEHPFVDYGLARRNAAGTYLERYVDAVIDWNVTSCRIWGVEPADPMEGQSVRTSIPTLFLQGRLDPVTPADYLVSQLGYFSQHEVLFFDDSSHWGSVTNACAMDAIQDFIERKEVRDEFRECGKERRTGATVD